MRLLFVLFAFTTVSVFAATHSNSQAPLEESDAFHNSPYGPVENMPQERQEEAPQWITPDTKQLKEEVPAERVNEWRENNKSSQSMGEEP